MSESSSEASPAGDASSAGAYLLRPRSWQRLARFTAYAITAVVTPSSYTQASRALTVRQVYLTAWSVLPGYLAFSALLSMILIEIVRGAAYKYGVAPFSQELVLRVLVLELIPLVTALFVALRSGSAIGAQIALMRVDGSLASDDGDDEFTEELAPRVAAAALSVFTLTTLACALAMYITYALFYGTSVAGFHVFTRIVGHVFDGVALMAFVLKCVLFGLAVAVIPLATGLEAEPGQPRTVPAAVLAGLVKLFIVIGAIEGFMLLIQYG
jgi:phospholipid/cholesterol/gamma-HCH transport system permease protein